MKTGERLKVLRGAGGFFSKSPPKKNKTVKQTKKEKVSIKWD
jgi:hypothetical protein